MTFDPALFGSKLKRYRELFNFSLGDVSIATGISEDYLSTLENGENRPTGDEVLILADYYKEDYNFFISNDQISTGEKLNPCTGDMEKSFPLKIDGLYRSFFSCVNVKNL